MDETIEKVSPNDAKPKVLESPKPVAFTVDFGENRSLDPQRFKTLVEKYQNRHRRGQSLSKIEEPNKASVKKPPLTGNLPRKSGYHMEGYYSSDEKMEKFKTQGARSTVLNSVMKKAELTLPLKTTTVNRMSQSFPTRSFDLPVIDSPEVEIKDISSPELEPMSPLSPIITPSDSKSHYSPLLSSRQIELHNDLSINSGSSSDELILEKFISCVDLDKADNVSDAGTYTIETDNYTEEQKQRMSIDTDFNIEQVSVLTKTKEYIQSLILGSRHQESKETPHSSISSTPTTEQKAQIGLSQNTVQTEVLDYAQSPNSTENNQLNNVNIKTAKVINSIQVTKNPENIENADKGVFTLVTTSGVLNKRQQNKEHSKQCSLVKSVIAVETYPTNFSTNNGASVLQSMVYTMTQHQSSHNGIQRKTVSPTSTVRSISQGFIAQNHNHSDADREFVDINGGRVTNLPPSVGGSSGKNSPSKLPSPLHTARNRNSYSSANCDLSDSSLETESYLKPTQNIITSLQQRLSIDSDSENDHDRKYKLPLNNEAKILLKSKPVHVRHNSFDDRNIKLPNKLEHFHNKNLQGIDQTFKSSNQYSLNKQVHQIQNSPNNSPIRRSSSFSLKNQFDNQPKCLNTQVHKDNNYRKRTNSPCSTTIQRSSSTANIKPRSERRSSIQDSDSHVSDRNSYVESESSSEEEFDKTVIKNKKDLTNTRYNRAFSLRRARLDVETPTPRCPNTPEMRRKFGPSEKSERTVSVDRKGTKSTDIPSRYLNLSKTKPVPSKPEIPKQVLKGPPKPQPNKAIFSRTDSGRFSLRSPKPVSAGGNKPIIRRDQQGKKQSGPRSNSTLSSREVEFQNWKRRKSYDPMKAAAEGKKKAELARKQNIMTQSYNENSQEYDSSPSHSSSVHRSQSFHGTAALEQNMISSEDDDLTLSADEGFITPPTPSPCELSPAKIRHDMWRDKYNSNH